MIGREARAQILKAEGKLPSAIIACVGGGSNSIGIFHDFLKDKKVRLIGVEAGGRGDRLGEHAARFCGGSPGVLQGTYSYVLQDDAGQIAATHSISAGLDYPSIGPEHAWLKDTGPRRIRCSLGCARRSQPARCWPAPKGLFRRSNPHTPWPRLLKRAPKMKKSEVVIVNVSGRGDKDIGILRENLELS